MKNKTELGKLMASIRAKSGLTVDEISQKLNCGSRLILGVESGSNNVTEKFINKFIEQMVDNKDEENLLRKMALKQRGSATLRLTGNESYDELLSEVFIRLQGVSKSKLKEILKILGG